MRVTIDQLKPGMTIWKAAKDIVCGSCKQPIKFPMTVESVNVARHHVALKSQEFPEFCSHCGAPKPFLYDYEINANNLVL